jgi:hypothetical protein
MREIVVKRYRLPLQTIKHIVEVPDWLVVAYQGFCLVVLFVGLLAIAFGAP